ncbi:MAG: hypothetical protein H6Q02_859, partial [Acidobacteria bacterium]|nr:hypothetical protein [Acidobacteriota bacterium]
MPKKSASSGTGRRRHPERITVLLTLGAPPVAGTGSGIRDPVSVAVAVGSGSEPGPRAPDPDVRPLARYASTAVAAFLPAATASTTVVGPCSMSPAG